MGDIKSRIEQFLRTGEGDFVQIALALYAYQYERNLPYQSYCRAQGISPALVLRWQDIPAVPVQAFKSAELATFPIGRAAAVFESSGTTAQTPSRHYLKTLSYYEASLKASFEKWVIGDSTCLFLILSPSPAEAPRSSLSWMMDVVKRRWGAPGSQFFVRNGRLDELWLATMLTKAQATREPAVLLGTTLAFLAFFEYCSASGRRFALPEGSRLMDTGGMKTRKREITRPDFVQRAREFLGISEDLCLNEYGMCEMSSQFYGAGVSPRLEGPPWVRTLVIDPSTGQPAPQGHTGILRHFDLANVDSVLAIQTEDLGMVPSPRADAGPLPEGEGFILLGRASHAELKGCSLAADAFLR